MIGASENYRTRPTSVKIFKPRFTASSNRDNDKHFIFLKLLDYYQATLMDDFHLQQKCP